jgi:magnesium transporter
VDNSQALEMANIYANILSSTLDAFASIISNNQNVGLKRLTYITIALQIPVLVASIYGMNVPLPFQGSHYAFYVPVVISVGLGLWLAWFYVSKRKHS